MVARKPAKAKADKTTTTREGRMWLVWTNWHGRVHVAAIEGDDIAPALASEHKRILSENEAIWLRSGMFKLRDLDKLFRPKMIEPPEPFEPARDWAGVVRNAAQTRIEAIRAQIKAGDIPAAWGERTIMELEGLKGDFSA